MEKRLTATNDRLRRSREELAVVSEQLAALRSDADDAQTRALVADGGSAKRDYAQARRHADRMEKARAQLVATVAELERAQDDLLDQLPSSGR